jgi:hypothetical protein
VRLSRDSFECGPHQIGTKRNSFGFSVFQREFRLRRVVAETDDILRIASMVAPPSFLCLARAF